MSKRFGRQQKRKLQEHTSAMQDRMSLLVVREMRERAEKTNLRIAFDRRVRDLEKTIENLQQSQKITVESYSGDAAQHFSVRTTHIQISPIRLSILGDITLKCAEEHAKQFGDNVAQQVMNQLAPHIRRPDNGRFEY